MNSGHHRDLTLCACHLAAIPEGQRAALIEGAAGADYLDDVTCPVPFHDEFPGTWSALCHFQRADGSGYLWFSDPSLGGLAPIGEAAMLMAGAPVSGKSEPMKAACLIQQGRVLADFRFPSAARMGSYWSTFPACSIENGRALHMIQDACIPHHAWNVLLWGHQDFEDALEHLWDQHRTMLKACDDPKQAERDFCKLVRDVECKATTVERLIKDNAAWTLEWFGKPHRHEECSIQDCLAVCVRAVASTIHGLRLMKGTHAS